MKKFKRVSKRIVGIVLLVLLLLAVGFKFYASDYNRSDVEIANEIQEMTRVYEFPYSDGVIFAPQDQSPKAVIVFYPGGKVEFKAYSGLMRMLADRGYLCILPRMPENLAFLRIDAIDMIVNRYPEEAARVADVDWYMAGHSLGGVAAAQYLHSNQDEYKGLILCASYTTSDFSDSGLRLLSILGSEDKVINIDNYNENKTNWPKDHEEYVIEGGIHSYFGNYGIQSGDGNPAISNIEQIEKTADAIADWIG